MSLLSVNDLGLSLGGRPLLQAIDLELGAGEVLALIGPNGAGKSTLLRAVAGELPARRGRIRWQGRAIADYPLAERAQWLAVLPQFSQLSFPFSVDEVVLLGRSPHASGRDRDREIATELMGRLDLLSLRHRLYPELSGGEKQRVQLARVLAQAWQEDRGPGLLLLDEPASALDLQHQQLLLSALERFRARGVSVVMAVHDINLAATSADRILALRGGRSLACEAPEVVLRPVLLQQLFDTQVDIVAHPRSGKPVVLGL